MRARTPITMWIAAFWLITMDIPTRLGLGPLATVTNLAMVVGVTILLWPVRDGGRDAWLEPRLTARRSVPWSMWVFLIYAFVRLAVDFSAAGMQNVLLYATFVFTIVATTVQISAGTARVWLPRLASITVATSAVYLAAVLITGPDTDVVWTARLFAATQLVGVCIMVPVVTRNLWSVTRLGVVVLAIASSLSRTAMAVSWLLLAFLAVRRPTIGAALRTAAMVLLVAIVGIWAIENIPAISARFTSNDNASLFGLDIGTTGRAALWAVATESWQNGSVLFGNGPGSVQAVLSEQFGAANGNPHNEYLRILHDYGIVGLALLSIAMAHIVARIFKAWAADAGTERAVVHQSALAAIVVLVLMATTSNITVYIFCMAPIGAIIGLSLGSEHLSSATVTSTHPGVRLRSTKS